MIASSDIVEVVRILNAAGVRYLIVGGLAVIAHGYVRLTKDLDLVIDLAPDNARTAMEAFKAAGFRPRVPVPIEDYARADLRRQWMDEKDMVVFTVWRDGRNGPTEVDCFIEAPFDVAMAWHDALWLDHPSGERFPIVDRQRLIAMKRAAGRPKDLLDIEELDNLQS